ncbi:ATP-binding cassette domain-containing protein [Nocardioides seonyuensis]|uniref:ATP-binding cassette domain-containing protein n=1 Tax=Nocardioides seonyuensis TaxID=2518371 RepID=A0A4P7IHD8_9ACTN|nr:ATP-binding cassette domain-containing protein [Nocardioides seonyuensis]QBX55181.1 ATP-binding cassette domain-containing protein [Nocardioides seonyuensis]
MSTTHALSVTGAIRRYRNGTEIGPFQLDVREGQCLGLVGSNGAGKSTLMRMILGLEPLDGGTISVAGNPVRRGRPTPGVTGMLEHPALFGSLSAADNLRAAFPSRRLGNHETSEALRRVGLGEVGRQPAAAFSLGMRQRLALARVLLTDAGLIVLDEPTNGLDPIGIRWLLDLVRDMTRAEGRAVILSSHQLHDVQVVADHYLMVADGRPLVAGAIAELGAITTLEELYFSSLDHVE